MIVEKDINGVEYSYENKDEIAFGTYFEEESEEDKPREEEIKREEAFNKLVHDRFYR
jgi:hypothetical protein